jgi:hypothetical protein
MYFIWNQADVLLDDRISEKDDRSRNENAKIMRENVGHASRRCVREFVGIVLDVDDRNEIGTETHADAQCQANATEKNF